MKKIWNILFFAGIFYAISSCGGKPAEQTDVDADHVLTAVDSTAIINLEESVDAIEKDQETLDSLLKQL